MLNILWPAFFIISFLYALICGKLIELNNSIFSSIKGAVDLCISMGGTLCFWSGIMKIATSTGITKKIEKILNPITRKIFPDIQDNDKARESINMNIVTNIMGLGNASTPLGLKAMQEMQKTNKNKNKLSNSMALFIVLNTASIQIIPTTVIAIRNSLNSNNATGMIIPVWISTICACIAALSAAKILMKKF